MLAGEEVAVVTLVGVDSPSTKKAPEAYALSAEEEAAGMLWVAGEEAVSFVGLMAPQQQ